MIAVQARPFTRVIHQALLDRVLSDVLEDLNIGLPIEHLFTRIAALPDCAMPVVNSRDLAREIALEVTHKAREIFGLLGADQEVEVVAQEDMVVDLDRVLVALEGVAEDAASDRGDLILWA